MTSIIESAYDRDGGMEIGDLDLGRQKVMFETSCESDSFYTNSRVVTYLDNSRERHVVVATVDEAFALIERLREDNSNTDVRHWTVPAYCQETFGNSPARTRRDAEAWDAEIKSTLTVQRGRTASRALSQDAG